jgi:hypothetical protein
LKRRETSLGVQEARKCKFIIDHGDEVKNKSSKEFRERREKEDQKDA